MYEPTSDQQASGRIGPPKVFLNQQSGVGDVSIEGTRIESLSNFSSIRASTAVFKACRVFTLEAQSKTFVAVCGDVSAYRQLTLW